MLRYILIKNALNKILAHSIETPEKKIRKGKVLIKEDINLIQNIGLEKIYVFDANNNYIAENKASKNISKLIIGKNIKIEKAVNGRADLHSKINGMLTFDVGLITKINFENDDVAISLLKFQSIVKKNQLIGNVKILPYAMKKNKYNKIMSNSIFSGLLNVIQPSVKKISLVISANNHSIKQSQKIIKSLNERLLKFNLKIGLILYSKHTYESVLDNLLKLRKKNIDLILLYGSNSIVDRNDIFPKSLRKVNGKIIAFGAPTDPGNLLMIGTLEKKNVIGVPGCAKSPLRNGFDEVLEKTCYGIRLDKKKISSMSNGGLFKSLIKKG